MHRKNRYCFTLLLVATTLIPSSLLPQQSLGTPLSAPIAQSPSAGKAEAVRLIQQGFEQYKANQLTEAQASLEKALQLLRQIKDPKGEMLTLGLLGVIYREVSDYLQAIDALERLLVIARTLSDRENQASANNELASVYYALGNYTKALEYAEQSLAIAREIQDRTTESAAVLELGTIYYGLGNYAKSIEYTKQSLALTRMLSDRQGEAAALSTLGNNYYSLGDYTQAIDYQRQSLVITQAIQNRRGEAQSLGSLGVNYYKLGDYAKAIDYHQQSLAIKRENKDRAGEGGSLTNLGLAYSGLGNYPKATEYHQQALGVMREIKYRFGEGAALANLGEALFSAGKFTDSEAPLRQSIQTFESLRQGLEDSQKISIADTQRNPYTTLQQVLIAQKRPDAALAIAEQGRARAFVELLAKRKTDRANIKIQPITVSEIINVAKTEKATVVEYSTLTDDALGIWVISPNGKVDFRQVNLKPLNASKISLNKLIILSRCFGQRACEARIAARSGSATELPAPDLLRALQTSTPNEHLKKLHQTLIQPIADLLPSDPNAKIAVVPQDSLFLVPFAALQDAQNNYLIDQHTLLVLPSIQVLQLIQQQRKPTARQNPLIVGNPSPMAGNLLPLPGAESEAIEIAKLLKIEPVLNEQATKASVIKQMQSASLIHLATHGTWDSKEGLNSAIALAPVEGFLTAAEILDLKLNADLVVMSACDSARGKVTGDGVIGLSRSLFTAGVPSIVATLWKIPDEPTKSLMIDFYKHRQMGENKAQALRSAILNTKAKYPNLINWAAFLLLGSGD